jgi:5-methylcytosine-specific restriction endonuclease McrA
MSRTPLSDLIEEMIARGATNEVIIGAARAMETALNSFYTSEPPSAIRNRRAWDRERKSRLPPNWAKMTAYVFKRDGYACTYCGDVPERLHCDHIIPLSRGGLNEFDNLTTACPPCNLDKGKKLISEWDYYGFGGCQ